MHIIVFVHNDAEGYHEPVQAGYGLVPNGKFDKVLPVQEHVAYQMEKVIYKDGKLQVKEEFKESWMDEARFKQYMAEKQNENNYGGTGALGNIDSEIVEVEL